MAAAKLTLDVKDLPEVIYAVRHELAQTLREEAESESDPRIARRLLELAARFEVGDSAHG